MMSVEFLFADVMPKGVGLALIEPPGCRTYLVVQGWTFEPCNKSSSHMFLSPNIK